MKKPGRRLPDTNVVIRYLVKDDIELYKQAKTFFDNVKTGVRKAPSYLKVWSPNAYTFLQRYIKYLKRKQPKALRIF